MRETWNNTFPKTKLIHKEQRSINNGYQTKLSLFRAVVLHAENVCLFGNCPSENLDFHSLLHKDAKGQFTF